MNLRIKRFLLKVFGKSIKAGKFFRFMVILSALHGLVYTLLNFVVVFFKDHLIQYINSSSFPETFYFYKENLLFFVSSHRLMYMICFIAGLFILNGCHLLFRGYKWGLLFYTIAKFFQVATPLFFLGYRALAIGDVMIILLFLVYYYYYSFSHVIEKENRAYTKIKIEKQN